MMTVSLHYVHFWINMVTAQFRYINNLAEHVCRLNPVLRLRDARFLRRRRGERLAQPVETEMTAQQLDLLAKEW